MSYFIKDNGQVFRVDAEDAANFVRTFITQLDVDREVNILELTLDDLKEALFASKDVILDDTEKLVIYDSFFEEITVYRYGELDYRVYEIYDRYDVADLLHPTDHAPTDSDGPLRYLFSELIEREVLENAIEEHLDTDVFRIRRITNDGIEVKLSDKSVFFRYLL